MCRFSRLMGVSLVKLGSDKSSTYNFKQGSSADRANGPRENAAYLKPGRQKQAAKRKSGSG